MREGSKERDAGGMLDKSTFVRATEDSVERKGRRGEEFKILPESFCF